MVSRAVRKMMGVSMPSARSRRHTSKPVHVGEHHVEHEQVWTTAVHLAQGVGAVAGDGHVERTEPERGGDDERDVLLVVHDEDSGAIGRHRTHAGNRSSWVAAGFLWGS